MLHGAYCHTVETPHRDERGVVAHYAALWGMLKFVAENRKEMIRDQIEVFRRGFFDLPQMPIPDELLDRTYWPDLQNNVIIQEFPAAYIIPADEPFQLSSHQAAKLVDFLLFNDVQVEIAKKAFSHEGTDYPHGTYVVWMDQPKRGLANTILEDGMDISYIEGLTFYSPPAAWSHPLLWGVHRVRVEEDISIKTSPVNKAQKPKGSVAAKKGSYFAYAPTSIAAFQATNYLLEEGVSFFRATESFESNGHSYGTGTFLVPKAYEKSISNLITKYALDVSVVGDLPEHKAPMKSQRIAVYGDGGITACLSELGFAYDTVSLDDLNAGLIGQYDVFLNHHLRWADLSPSGQASLNEWFAAGGDYVGFGNGGAGSFGLPYVGRAIDFAVEGGIANVVYGTESGNSIVNIDYDPDDTVAAGFREDGHAFVLDPVWFTDLADGMQISALYGDEDLVVSGYWPDWQTSSAAGMPAIVHAENGDDGIQDTVLIGIDATFRGHTRNTFRLVGNAIFSGLD
jgi:hypothetical protein